MSVPAAAVSDIVAAPPPRSATTRASDDQTQSFEAHLAAASREEEATTASAAGEPTDDGAATSEDDGEQEKAVENVFIGQPQINTIETSAPLALQIADTANASAAQPASAEVSAEAVDTQPLGAQPNLTPDLTPNDAEASAKSEEPKAASGAASDTITRNADSALATPQTQTQSAQAPPQQPQIKAETAPAPIAQASQPNPAAHAIAAQAAPPQLEPQRLGKIAPKIADAKSANATEAKAFEQAVMQKTSPTPTASAPQAKDASAFAAPAPIEAPPTVSQGHSFAPTLIQASQVQPAAVERAAPHAPPAAAQVAREIVRRFDGGTTRFELRLDPPELGRVEVRLDVSRDHRVTAVVSAENPQALAELVRHARELEQTLQSAGLELTENGLSFDLRQSEREFADPVEAQGERANGGVEEQTPTAAVARPVGYERWRGVRVDMMV